MMGRVLRQIRSVAGYPLKTAIYRLFSIRLIVTSQQIKPTSGSAMVFAPHQDDESFGCGGMIAFKRASKIPVKVVYLTDGQKTYGWDRIPTQTLIATRQQEALQALDVLGVPPDDVIFLGQVDGSLQALNDSCRQSLIIKLVHLLSGFQPEEVYVTYRQDGHPDHEMAYLLVREAIHQAGLQLDLLEYPVWSLYQPFHLNFSAPEFKDFYRLSIAAVQTVKRQAIACHRSQYIPIPPDTQGGLSQTFLKRLSSPYEFFFKS